MTTSTKRSPQLIELDRRRAILSGFIKESRQGDCVGPSIKPGNFFWSDALITLLAKDPEGFLVAVGGVSSQMRVLAHCVKGKSGRARSQGLCDAVNTLNPDTCSLNGDRIVWNKAFTVAGESVSEIDFFLGYDLLDKEE